MVSSLTPFLVYVHRVDRLVKHVMTQVNAKHAQEVSLLVILFVSNVLDKKPLSATIASLAVKDLVSKHARSVMPMPL